MELKRWPAFLALTFSVSFRAFALAQELNDKPDAPGVVPKPIIGTIVVENNGKAEEKIDKKPESDLVPGTDELQGEILVDDGKGGTIRVWTGDGFRNMRGFSFTGNSDVESLPEFVIGVSLTEVPDSLRAHVKLAAGIGIMVGTVVPESPAAKAGIQQYDILLKARDKNLTQPKELQDLVDASAAKPISISIQRHGEQMTLEVTPIKREDLKITPDKTDHQTLLNAFGDGSIVTMPNGQGPTPLNFDFPPSPFVPPVGNLPQFEALTDSIRQLSEQVERLKGSIDKLEKNQSGDGERPEQRDNNRAKDDGDCWKLPRRDRLTTLISLS